MADFIPESSSAARVRASVKRALSPESTTEHTSPKKPTHSTSRAPRSPTLSDLRSIYTFDDAVEATSTDFIDRGGQGAVFKATVKHHNNPLLPLHVAVKKVSKVAVRTMVDVQGDGTRVIPSEAHYHRQASRAVTGVPRYYGCFEDHEHYYMTMELLTKEAGWMDLWRLRTPPSEAFAREMFSKVAYIVCQLAGTAGVFHFDVTTSNVMFNKHTREVKIIDFGLATSFSAGAKWRPSVDGMRGTPSWTAPEQRCSADYDLELAQTFSLGMLLHALTYGWRPCKKDGSFCPETVCQASKFKSVPQVVVSAEFSALITNMLSVDPKARPRMQELWRLAFLV